MSKTINAEGLWLYDNLPNEVPKSDKWMGKHVLSDFEEGNTCDFTYTVEAETA